MIEYLDSRLIISLFRINLLSLIKSIENSIINIRIFKDIIETIRH